MLDYFLSRPVRAAVLAFAALAGTGWSSAAAADAPAATQPATQAATQPAAKALPELFDPDLHLQSSDVQIGMRGYGLTVFRGTEIERFEVEVVGVLRKTQQLGTDVVLIRSDDPKLAVSGPIAGMSGSPIYLQCDDGRERLIGAFAFGWAFSKETIAGVQPIEGMLALDATPNEPPDAPPAVAGAGDLSYDLLAAGLLTRPELPEGDAAEALGQAMRLNVRPATGTTGPAMSLPLPVGLGGATPLVTDLLTRRTSEATGLSPVPLVAGTAGATEAYDVIEPGSALVVPLLMGDLELSAVGTCTTVIGDRVFGFGHPLFEAGPVTLPLAAGSVDAVIPLATTSFKLGSAGKVVGTLAADGTTGVAGTLGEAPPMTPIEFAVTYTEDSGERVQRTFNFEAADYPELTPALVASATLQAISLPGRLDADGAVRWRVTLSYTDETDETGEAEPREFTFADVASNRFGGPTTMALRMLTVIGGIAENPFGELRLDRVQGEVELLGPEAISTSTITSASLARSKYEPGETVRLDVELEQFRGGREYRTVELALPQDLPAGEYQVLVLSSSPATQLSAQARPGLMQPTSIDGLFEALNFIGEFPSTALYVRLMRPDRVSVVVGPTALPSLPPTRLSLLANTNRSDIQPATVGETNVVELPFIVSEGMATTTITVERP